jgi:riboflavin kinase/FMN adenylyltransferase
MRILAWNEVRESRQGEPPLAAAVGVFDGLHLGHMRLMREVLDRDGCARGAVTFRENPKKVLRPSSFHGDIFTLDQKLATLSELGLDLCVLIDFSGDFSKLAGKDFLSLLRDRFNLRFLAVGANFRCGHRLDTDAAGIQDFFSGIGVETRILEPICAGGRPVSSSRIRTAIRDGRLEEARALLGREFELDLAGATFIPAGDSIRIRPVAGQVEPPPGSYRGKLSVDGAYRQVSMSYANGEWSLRSSDIAPGGASEPRALRLVSLVSRE